MSVDQSRHQYPAIGIDHRRTSRRGDGFRDLRDLVALDEHAHAFGDLFVLAIEYIGVLNERGTFFFRGLRDD